MYTLWNNLELFFSNDLGSHYFIKYEECSVSLKLKTINYDINIQKEENTS